jgi:hypothetical protein
LAVKVSFVRAAGVLEKGRILDMPVLHIKQGMLSLTDNFQTKKTGRESKADVLRVMF